MLFNIFGGITRCDEVARGLIEAFEQVEADGARSSCGSTARTTWRAASCSPTPRCPTSTSRRRWTTRRRRSWSWRAMSVLVDKDTRLVVSGITGREGTFHALNNRRYGTQVVAGVTPGKGGQDVEGIPVFDTFDDAVRDTGANTAMIFVPPRFAADSILEAADAGITTDHRDHRGHPRARRAARLHAPRAHARRAPRRPELPRRPVARQGQRRHHPGVLLQGGQRRRRVALGHADLPDRQRARPARLRQLVDRRHRRRPGPGLVVHRRPRAVRGGPGDRADRDVRRDRRRRRGGGRRVHRGQRHQAGRRLHRRLHRAAGQDDGPRRRDRLRLAGHRRGEGRGAGGEGRPRRPHADRGRAIAVEILGG